MGLWGNPKLEDKRGAPFKDAIKRNPLLKELKEKKYLSPYADLSRMLDDLLEKGIIQLPKLNRLAEIGSWEDG